MSTTPVEHDHPDWARTVSAATIKVFQLTQSQGAASIVHGRFFVGNLPQLWVSLSAVNDGARLQLDWYDAISGGSRITQNTVDVLNQGFAHGPIPTLGPYVEVTTLVNSTPTIVGFAVWQGLVSGQSEIDAIANTLLSVDGQNVNALTTVTHTAQVVRWGWGHWHSIFDNGTDTLSRLYAVDYTGTATLLDTMGAGISNDSRLVLLPRMPVRIVSLNADAVARALYLAVLFHPGPV